MAIVTFGVSPSQAGTIFIQGDGVSRHASGPVELEVGARILASFEPSSDDWVLENWNDGASFDEIFSFEVPAGGMSVVASAISS